MLFTFTSNLQSWFVLIHSTQNYFKGMCEEGTLTCATATCVCCCCCWSCCCSSWIWWWMDSGAPGGSVPDTGSSILGLDMSRDASSEAC